MHTNLGGGHMHDNPGLLANEVVEMVEGEQVQLTLTKEVLMDAGWKYLFEIFPKQTEIVDGNSNKFSAYFGLYQSGMDWLLDLSDHLIQMTP